MNSRFSINFFNGLNNNILVSSMSLERISFKLKRVQRILTLKKLAMYAPEL